VKSIDLARRVGPGPLPQEPYLLRVGVAEDRILVAREESTPGVATQRVPGGAVPAPPGEGAA
jgi:hypothetical protein